MLIRLKEIFNWRHLIFSLVIRDLKIKYLQATGGFGWMLARPLVQMLIFCFIFGVVFKIRIDRYPLFLLSGLFLWGFLHSSLDCAQHSILNNAHLIKKNYFPREIIPISAVFANLAVFLLSLVVLLCLSLFLEVKLSAALCWLPVIILTQAILTIGISLLLSCLTACFKEVQFISDTLFLIWFYATPVVYSLDMVKSVLPDALNKIYLFNPAIGITIGYQNIFADGISPDLKLLLYSFSVSLFILMTGFYVFRHYEDVFMELI